MLQMYSTPEFSVVWFHHLENSAMGMTEVVIVATLISCSITIILILICVSKANTTDRSTTKTKSAVASCSATKSTAACFSPHIHAYFLVQTYHLCCWPLILMHCGVCNIFLIIVPFQLLQETPAVHLLTSHQFTNCQYMCHRGEREILIWLKNHQGSSVTYSTWSPPWTLTKWSAYTCDHPTDL